MGNSLSNIQPGLLTGDDIVQAVAGDEIIIAPFYKENVTPVGYNFSFSMFIMSVNTTKFQKIKEDKNGQLFFWLKPNETVLILTLEAIKVPQNIGGTFHSKVSIVSDGLSHVSTTLDPGWSGQLLVPMNNPTNKAKRVIIGHNIKRGNGFEPEFNTFLTLVLYKSSTIDSTKSDNKASRLDLLIEKIMKDGKKIKDKDLSEAVEKMRVKIDEYEEYCGLSHTSQEKDIKFKETCNNIASLNKSFMGIISSNKTQTHITRVFFCVLLILFVGTIITCLCCGTIYSEVQWLFSVVTPILSSILIVIFKPLLDKFWW